MRDDGYIVVETVGAFVPFIFLVVSILSLVNIVTLQTRVHYALTQAANTLSMYCYALEISGAAGSMMKIGTASDTVKAGADATKLDIAGVVDGIKATSLSDAGIHGRSAFERALGAGESIADDPVSAVQLMAKYGIGEGAGALTEQLVRPLVGRYLANGSLTGDEYLKSFSVKGGLRSLDFYKFDLFDTGSVGHTNSALIDSNGDVMLVAQYEIEYKFGALPLPFKPSLKVTQTARTKAWMGGEGEGYSG